MKKIKFKDVKPGMVIQTKEEKGQLILHITGKSSKGKTFSFTRFHEPNYYLGYSVWDATYGPCYGSFDPKEKVKVLRGKKREKVIQRIRRSLRKEIWNRQENLNVIDLIEELHS